MTKQDSSSAISVLEVGIAALLVTGLWFSYSRFTTSRQEVVNLSAELSKSESLVPQIKALRQKPDQATLASHSARALAQAIEQSATQAQITPEQIASIEPQTPRRAGDTAYMEHATVVQLERVSLGELAKLSAELRHLDASLGQLHIVALRVDAPYQQSSGDTTTERWNIEFTLTYFVYSPKSSPSRAS